MTNFPVIFKPSQEMTQMGYESDGDKHVSNFATKIWEQYVLIS